MNSRESFSNLLLGVNTHYHVPTTFAKTRSVRPDYVKGVSFLVGALDYHPGHARKWLRYT